MIDYTNLPYNKTMLRKIRLPMGNAMRGNLCFLFSPSFEASIHTMSQTENCLNYGKYKFYYRQLRYRGITTNKKRYRVNDVKEFDEIKKKLREEVPNIKIYPKRMGIDPSERRNIYVDLYIWWDLYLKFGEKLSLYRKMDLFWGLFNQVLAPGKPTRTDSYGVVPRPGNYDNYFVLMDVSKFPLDLKVRLKDRINNPMYMMYMTILKRSEYLTNLNLDFVFFAGNRVLRVKPCTLTKRDARKFLAEMKKLYRNVPQDENAGVPTEEEITVASEPTEEEKKEATETQLTPEEQINAVDTPPVEKDVTDAEPEAEAPKIPIQVSALTSSKKVPKSVKSVVTTIPENKEIEKKITEKTKEVTADVEKAAPADVPQKEKDQIISQKIEEEIDNDEELLTQIYMQMQQKAKPVASQRSTARDEMLREKQKDIVVHGASVKDLAALNPKEKQIESNDISKAVTTTNPNINKISFQNFNQSYTDKVMDKDIVGVFENLNNASIKMFIRDIKVEDTSDVLNYKDTWTVYLEDGNRTRHTIKVDIPKFYDKNFLWLSGNKKTIKNQLFFLPVVKLSSDTVMIVTNYNKLTIKREDARTLREISKLVKQIRKNPSIEDYFVPGSAAVENADYITAVEYDEYAKIYLSFQAKNVKLYFNQSEASDIVKKKNLKKKDNAFFIGFEGKDPIWIDYNTQRDEKDRGISDIIYSCLPEEDQSSLGKITAPKRLMYTKITTMKQDLPMIVLMCLWEGLSKVLDKAKVKFRIEMNTKSLKPSEDFIKFKNCYLIYDADVPTELLLNGIKVLDTENYEISEYDTQVPYLPFFQKKFGKLSILNALNNVYEFTIGPIEREILLTLKLPTDLLELMVYANGLLGDSQAISELDLSEYRVRCAEVIPAILYDSIAKAYVPYKNSNGKKKLSIPQDAVIKKLLALQTTEDASTLNPFLELETTHGVSTKGWRGVNLEDSYTIPKRSYDASMTGVIGVSSSPDGQVGVNRTLTMEPSIETARGYIDVKKDNLDELKDVNLFSPAEIMIPLGATRDDPIRTGHSVKQSRATIPVKNASPVLLSNGSDEMCKYYLSSDFVVNADEDGKVVEIDDKTKIMVVEYKSGKHRAINLDKNIVKNGGGGFELSNVLITDLKVGDTFKKNETLAWHQNFFKKIPTQGVRMNVGALVKVALYSSYNTYEDADFITEKVAEMCSTEMCFRVKTSIGKNSNVYHMVKVGDRVAVGDSLIDFDESFEDSDINKLLASLGDNEELKEVVTNNSRNSKKSKYSGVVEEIKIYSASELEDLSPSLQTIVSKYYKKIDAKKKLLNKYDKEGNTVKCGLMMTESSGRTEPDRYGNIRGIKVDDGVAIEFYIKHSEPLEVGSKVANFSPLKNIVSEIIPAGYEPYSELHPEESVDSIISPSSILNRMVASVLPTIFGNKCIIELKNSLYKIWNGSGDLPERRKKMVALIYKFFKAMDPTGANVKKYKDLFEPMTDTKFKSFFTEFFGNPDHYLILDIVDYERDLQVTDIEAGAKVLGIPLFEYVTFPHFTMDKEHPIVTKHRIPVGYLHLKRPQQTVMKKNGMSIEADQRSAFTGQVTGKDKNGRESDLENSMLVSLGMEASLKELNGPRADDPVMKREMLQEIKEKGYTQLADLTDNIENKTTLNTINTYFLGMGLHTDLVSKGLTLPYTTRKE